MSDIPPLAAVVPVLKPIKIKRDEKPIKDQNRQKKPATQQSNPGAAQHIDEMI